MNFSSIILIAAATTAVPSATWTFETDQRQKAPTGFTFSITGEGRTGRWIVLDDKGAPSGRGVLAQVDVDDTDYRFPLAVVTAPSLKNLRLSVKCKPVDGKIDQACGLVFRFKDENNYYVTRANALENNVRLYHVQDGRRVQFAGWNGRVSKNAWHDLAVEVRDDKFQVFFDGRFVIEATDHTFAQSGKFGLWTKADSVTYFDDLAATSF